MVLDAKQSPRQDGGSQGCFCIRAVSSELVLNVLIFFSDVATMKFFNSIDWLKELHV
jgi:hypothetical protein